MLPKKLITVVCLTLFFSFSNLGFAEDQQTWSVQFENETAIVRASEKALTKHIQATIAALHAEGIEKFALKTLKQNTEFDFKKVSIVVRIIEKDAELTLAPNLPHKHVISIIRHLNEVGIEEVKLTLAKESPEAPAN